LRPNTPCRTCSLGLTLLLPLLLGAGAAAQAVQPACDWPVVVSCDPGRPIRQQRSLYEAVLQLERDGASVLERPLALIDAVLSPSAALIIFDNTKSNLVGEAGDIHKREHLGVILLQAMTDFHPL
jgi:hypothetical protein